MVDFRQRLLTGRQICRASRNQMIQPIGGSPPTAQTLAFRGHLTGAIHSDLLLCPPGYDPDDEDTTYPIGIFWHGKESGAANAVNVIRTRLQGHMGSTIRPVIGLFPEGGLHSWYKNNVIADTDVQAVGAQPYHTLIEQELYQYVTERVRWNGQLFGFGFSMGCQNLASLEDLILYFGMRAMMFTAGPRLRYDNGGPWVGADAAIFADIWGAGADNPASNPKYVALSPQTKVISGATTIKQAIAAHQFALRCSCGADDPTLIGHDLFRTGVLDAQGIAYTRPPNYPGVDHNWPNCVDADGATGANIWAFFESMLF